MKNIKKVAIEKPSFSSKVLLICIDNKNNSIITQKLLYNYFLPFGAPKQILIFERGKVWKAFVEMDSETAAKMAKESLHNQLIFSDGTKMLVHYSALEKISLQESESLKSTGSFKSFIQTKGGPTVPKIKGFSSENHIERPAGANVTTGESYATSEVFESKIIQMINPPISPCLTPLLCHQSETTQSKPELSAQKVAGVHFSFGSISETQTQNVFSEHGNKSLETLKNAKLKKSNTLNFTPEASLVLPRVVNIERSPKHYEEIFLGNIAEQRSLEDLNSPMKPKGRLNKEYKILFDITEDYLPSSTLKTEDEREENTQEHEEELRHLHSIFPTNKQVLMIPPSVTNKSVLKIDPLKLDLLDFDFQSNEEEEKLENPQSGLVLVGEFDPSLVKIHMIYNILSNFGNIFLVIYPKNSRYAIVSFQSPKQAEIAKMHLNGLNFLGEKLSITILPFQSVDFSSNPTPSQEIRIPEQQEFRFKTASQKKLTINPPSVTLHISNLKTEVCNYEQINELFKKYGKIEAIKFKVLDHYKNMCLIKYSNLEESFLAMAYLHDYELMKRKIKVSFTKSKIEKD